MQIYEVKHAKVVNCRETGSRPIRRNVSADQDSITLPSARKRFQNLLFMLGTML